MTVKKDRRRAAAQERETVEIPHSLTDKEQEVADLLAKRQASDKLQPQLDARAAAREQARAEARAEDADAPVETETGTITRYVPWSFPHGYVVIELPSRQVEAPEPGKPAFETFEEADTHARQLNTWLSRRPTPGARYRRFILPPEPTEAGIIEMLDRIAEIDHYPAAVYKTIEAVITQAVEAAEATDHAAALRRTAAHSANWKWNGTGWQELGAAVGEDTEEIPAS